MNIEQMIETLWQSIQQGVHDPEALRGKLSIEDAYRVQLGLLDRYEEAGEALIGWKVGLTAKAIQEQAGYYEPIFGFLLRSGYRQSGADFEFAALRHPGYKIRGMSVV